MSEDMMNIKIKLTNACIYDVNVPKSATVKELKEACSKHENIQVEADEQHLVSKGRILDNEKFLSDYYITNDHTMILVKKSYEAKTNKYALEEEEEETTNNKGTQHQAKYGGFSGIGGINQGNWGNYSGLSNNAGFGSYGGMSGHGGFESFGGMGGHGSFGGMGGHGSFGGIGGHVKFGGPAISALGGISGQGPSSILSSLGASSNHSGQGVSSSLSGLGHSGQGVSSSASGLGASSSLSGLGANQPSGTDATNMNALITMLSDPSSREKVLNSPQIKALLDANPQMRVMLSDPQMLQMMLNNSAGSNGTGTFENIGNPKELYKDENNRLKDMGFTDEELNYDILAQTFGNVDGAVEKLLNMMN